MRLQTIVLHLLECLDCFLGLPCSRVSSSNEGKSLRSKQLSLLHAVDQSPNHLELSDLTQSFDQGVEGFSGVFELALLLGPTEERQRQDAGVAESVKDLEDELRRGLGRNGGETGVDGGSGGGG